MTLLAIRIGLRALLLWVRARLIRRHRDADRALRAWAADPRNFCDRPGCDRCWRWAL
ncbi:hypothetical protein HNP84_000199 [Thermocatellispora tengchongensis]|uniref:Uncharacterized protein n=1 Tax=Thermocatellispora tengchongensis TaxID=1073253 RepID=A0A840NXX7_9ACTN|nr:hypothetical protein [Thermocatellispora tengchongensis]MBB5130511.1 hypothetical protein [Thermocatellispora tengchongensis]